MPVGGPHRENWPAVQAVPALLLARQYAIRGPLGPRCRSEDRRSLTRAPSARRCNLREVIRILSGRQCLTVAACALGLLVASPPWRRRAPTQVTVATWNIAWFGDGIRDEVLRGNQRGGRYLREAADFDRLGAIVTRLADHGVEVVGLQEVENADAVRRIFPQTDWELFLSRRDTDPEWSQRTAIVVRRSAGWRVERHPDIVEWSPQGRDRHGVDVTLSRGPERVRVLTVHFQSGCQGDSLHSGERPCGFLRMQLAVLKGWLFDRMGEGIPAVVAGDWNRFLSRPDDGTVQELPGNPLVLPPASRAPACWSGRFDNYVDHIVAFAPPGQSAASSAFEEVLYEAPESARDRLSDHCPLVANLEFSRPK